jgi:GNAT superfamily N-acetyltransferase
VSAQRVAWLAEEDGVPLGMVNVMLFERMPRPGQSMARWGYVANVYVVPEHRGVGIGARFLGAVTAFADDEGLVRLVLSPTERSVPLYGRFGFTREHDLLVRGRTH